MIINHNIASLNTYRQLSINNTNQGKALEKLSSGLRINRAGDDAAGLAISEKMRAQIRGLDQASRNAQDAISLIQTAEGALNETHAILQRMRELAVQAANDTNVTVDRQEIQKEINQLTSEINRIGNTTEFNTQKLLNGSLEMSEASAAQVIGTGVTGTIEILDAATKSYATGVAITSPVQIREATGGSFHSETAFKTNVGADLSSGDNNELTITITSGEHTQTVTVVLDKVDYDGSAGKTKTDMAADIATKINAVTNADVGGVTVGFDANNKLVITTQKTGAGNSIRIDGGNFLSVLGNASSYVYEDGINSNDTLSIDIDGETVTKTLTAKTYNTVDELVSELNTQFNTTGVTFTNDGGMVKVERDVAGSTKTIANFTGSAAAHIGLTNATVIAGKDVNNIIKFKVDGSTEYTATLNAGTYNLDVAATRIALAQQLQAAMNAVSGMNDLTVEVNGDSFVITSGTKGSNSKLQITQAHNTLGFKSTTEVVGDDGHEAYLQFQIGANKGQAMAMSISDMRSLALGISGDVGGATANGVGTKVAGATFTISKAVTNGTNNTAVEYALDVTDHEKASAAVEVFQQAIEAVSAERSKLGAYQNRLEHTITNLGTSSENLTAAESRIRDVDMAKEMMEFTKNNILQQAAQAMLAQANQMPQGVLQLLR